MDVFSQPVDPVLFARLDHGAKPLRRPSLDDETAEAIVTRLAEAERPVMYVGGGVLLARASEELRQFVEHLGLPVAYSLMGKGALSDDHPQTLGMTGWGTAGQRHLPGCRRDLRHRPRFKEADSSSWYRDYTFNIPDTALIHIDIEPSEISRTSSRRDRRRRRRRGGAEVLNRVARALPRRHRPSGHPSAHRRVPGGVRRQQPSDGHERCLSDDAGADPCRHAQRLPDDAYLTTDVGWNKNGVGQQFPIRTPGTVLTPGGFATMGFGPSAAIGAKLAAPDRTVVSLVGDGGFGQNPAMLATAVEHGSASSGSS